MTKPRAVVDTNIFVSALLGGRTCCAIVDLIDNDAVTLVFSNPLLKEIQTVLTDKELGNISSGDVERLFKTLERRSLIVNPGRTLDLCRDPEDNIVLEAALEGEADFLVTGDKDLLSLRSLHKTHILSPAEFIKLIQSR